nr:puromycin n-acetyltransferase [Quercus suber]
MPHSMQDLTWWRWGGEHESNRQFMLRAVSTKNSAYSTLRCHAQSVAAPRRYLDCGSIRASDTIIATSAAEDAAARNAGDKQKFYSAPVNTSFTRSTSRRETLLVACVPLGCGLGYQGERQRIRASLPNDLPKYVFWQTCRSWMASKWLEYKVTLRSKLLSQACSAGWLNSLEAAQPRTTGNVSGCRHQEYGHGKSRSYMLCALQDGCRFQQRQQPRYPSCLAHGRNTAMDLGTSAFSESGMRAVISILSTLKSRRTGVTTGAAPHIAQSPVSAPRRNCVVAHQASTSFILLHLNGHDHPEPPITAWSGHQTAPHTWSTMSTQGYVVLPATASDAPGMVAANKAAFADNPTTQFLYPKHLEHLTPPEELHAWQVKRYCDNIAKGEVLTKATPTDQPDVVAGLALWYRPGHFAKQENQRSSLLDADGHIKEGTPACLDPDAMNEFSISIESAREEIWGDNHDYWYLALLAVHPDHQGKGIASKLILHGVNLADQDGVPSYLVASERGTPVYRKCGFEPKLEPKRFRDREPYVAMVKSVKPKSNDGTV